MMVEPIRNPDGSLGPISEEEAAELYPEKNGLDRQRDAQVKAELTRLGKRAAEIDQRQKELGDELSKIRKRARELAQGWPSLFERTTTESGGETLRYLIPRTNLQVLVVTPKATPPVDYNLLLARIGQESFSQCVVIRSADMDVERWNELVEQELVTDAQLAECLGESPDMTSKVSFGKAPGGRNGK